MWFYGERPLSVTFASSNVPWWPFWYFLKAQFSGTLGIESKTGSGCSAGYRKATTEGLNLHIHCTYTFSAVKKVLGNSILYNICTSSQTSDFHANLLRLTEFSRYVNVTPITFYRNLLNHNIAHRNVLFTYLHLSNGIVIEMYIP